MTMINRYFVSGRLVLEAEEADSPRRGDEVCLDGRTYQAARVVRHVPMCPPDSVHVHLVMVAPEELMLPGIMAAG